eukprot:COSAG01_NODE_10536_length_2137_cov_9.826300_1_plen_113_part_10
MMDAYRVTQCNTAYAGATITATANTGAAAAPCGSGAQAPAPAPLFAGTGRVYLRTKNKPGTQTIEFLGPSIPVCALRSRVMSQGQLDPRGVEIVLTCAQTGTLLADTSPPVRQ